MKLDSTTESLIRLALAEDIGPGDVTTDSVVAENETAQANVIAKSRVVLSGTRAFMRVFEILDPRVAVESLLEDGDEAPQGSVVFQLAGPVRAILMGERVALNILAGLSGIATLTRSFVERVEGLEVKILDTRKTSPGMRALEKAAVRHGGGHNHRFGLFGGVLLKENHLRAAGGVSAAVKRAKEKAPHTLRVQVEVTDTEELAQAVDAGADAVLLDNMSPALLKEAVALAGGKILTEASGRVTLDNVRDIAETGVDMISIGALTHSAPAADFSLVFV